MKQRKLIGITPTTKQSDIIEGINSPSKYHIVVLGRQTGKSLLAQNLVLYWTINNPNTTLLWVSPVYSQTTKVQKELYKALVETDIVESCNYSENILTFKNGSEIVFRSGERYDNIRGGTYDYCVMDECAFMKSEVWEEAVRPTLLIRGKKVLFLSTPKGKNWFYELYMRGLSEEYPQYKSYKGTSFENPYADQSEIEDARKTLPPNIFKQEYLAEFIDDGGEVFSNITNNTFSKYPIPQGKVFGGIDLGRQDDYSVLTIMDSQGRVIDVYRNNQTEWSKMIDDMVSIIKKYNAITHIEINSMGDVIYEQMKKRVNNLHPFITNSKTKQEIIEGLIYDFNEGNIRIPSKELFPPLFEELSMFSYEYSTKTRNIKYGSPNGFHDDCVMSLGICNYSRKVNKNKGQYSYII